MTFKMYARLHILCALRRYDNSRSEERTRNIHKRERERNCNTDKPRDNFIFCGFRSFFVAAGHCILYAAPHDKPRAYPRKTPIGALLYLFLQNLSRCPDLNRGPTPYHGVALPAEVQRHNNI